ncbi:MAG: hypothetical protein N3D75_03880 [Candidatus Aenigmarchaeota archaeon]|nr:hypothetical protein [Candidatus Aenigmarchaeota archaeon]
MDYYEQTVCIYKSSKGNYWLFERPGDFLRLLRKGEWFGIFADLKPFHVNDLKNYMMRNGFFEVQANDIYSRVEEMGECAIFLIYKGACYSKKLERMKIFESAERIVAIMPISDHRSHQ